MPCCCSSHKCRSPRRRITSPAAHPFPDSNAVVGDAAMAVARPSAAIGRSLPGVVLHRERAAKMSIPAKQDEVEELCRRALQEYRQEGLRERLSEKWPYDRTVKDRISYDYPPTFQPGYVGPHYFASRRRDSS